jgi:hypothetical protein
MLQGILANGEEIVVKKLSKASTQRFEEFKNKVTLTAKLQHVNLVRVFGFCIEKCDRIITLVFRLYCLSINCSCKVPNVVTNLANWSRSSVEGRGASATSTATIVGAI